MKTVPALLALLLLAACGSETGQGPAAVTAAEPGQVTTGWAVTVLDDGDGAELCLGGVEESLPPQCSGPRLVGWDWSEHAGDFEHRGGVRWGDFQVTGSFADGEMTPSEVVPLAELGEPPAYDDGSLQRSLDDQYGAGTVRVQSALVPVGHSMLVD